MEQKEIIQIIKDLRDCPKDSTSKWYVDLCANKLIEKLEAKQLILSSVVKSFYCQDEKYSKKECCKEQWITCFSKE